MIKHNQNGQVSGLALSLGLTIFVLVGALGFAGWAFSSRQDYKNNTDEKVAAAVTVAKQQEDSLKDVAFTEAEKNPLHTYTGPQTYGSIIAQYPKNWSAYVDDTGAGASLVDGYFYPGTVPSISSPNSVFALRVQVLSQTYAQSVQALSAQAQDGKIKIDAYALPKVPKTVGVKAAGIFQTGGTGEVVMLPLRNQTLQISTQGSQFTTDFESKVLPNFTFSP